MYVGKININENVYTVRNGKVIVDGKEKKVELHWFNNNDDIDYVKIKIKNIYKCKEVNYES